MSFGTDGYSGGWESQVSEGYGDLAGRSGGYHGGGGNDGGGYESEVANALSRLPVAEQERLFREVVDPLMSSAYGTAGQTGENIMGFVLNSALNSMFPGLGFLSSITGMTDKATGWLTDNAVRQELQSLLGLEGRQYDNSVQLINEALSSGRNEQEIANAYNTVSQRRGGSMGLWEDITGKSAATAATGAAGTAASYQQQAIDYLKQMGAIPLAAQQGLAGIYGLPGGVGTQQEAIDQVKASPMYSSMIESGEDAILRRAGATGVLRSGNTQDALSRYSGDVLNQLYQQRLSGLSGLAGMGTYAPQVASGLSGIGSTLAAGQTAAAQAEQQGLSNLIGLGGSIYENIGGWEGIKDIGSSIGKLFGF